MKNRKFIIYMLLTMGCAVIIFMLSAQERSVSSANSLKTLTALTDFLNKAFHVDINKDHILGLHNFFRKTAHFSAYMILSIFSYNTFRLGFRQKKHAVLVTFIFCVLMAISDEIHQLFVSGRSAEVRDVLIDTLGICVGLGLIWIVNAIAKSIGKRKSKNIS